MSNKISSFAVLDLETSSLPTFNFNKTNITEISIHGFSAEDVIKAKNIGSPRINHKLNLLFNPRMIIEPQAEVITGLNNYMLEHESPLDNNAANVILNFLKHLRQPVCLVAHNGNDFDFRVMKHAFSKLGLEIPNEILFLDSLLAFKDLDKMEEIKEKDDMESFIPLTDSDINEESTVLVAESEKESKAVNEISKSKSITISATQLNNNEDNEEEQNNEVNESVSTAPINSEGSRIESTEIPNNIKSTLDWQTFNETTPKRPPNLDNIERKRKRQVEQNSPTDTSTEPRSRKSLKFVSTPTKTIKYSLGAIYERLFGNPPDTAHHAEADVISLEKILFAYGKSFVDYAEANARPFGEVKKLGAR